MPKPNRSATEFSKRVGDALVGAYKKHRLTQADLRERTGMTTTTLQRALSGVSDIDVEQLELLCAAIGVQPAEILDDALNLYGGLDRLVSEATATNVTQLHPRSMTTDELENYKGNRAANFDEEASTDEPE